MKYPIDPLTTETFFGHLIANDRAQRKTIQALSQLLTLAMSEMGMEDTDWYDEAKKFFQLQRKLQIEHETRIFNAKNGHPDTAIVKVDTGIEVGPVEEVKEVTHVPGITIDPQMNAELNEKEKAFGEEMSEEDIARLFNERPKKKSVSGVDMSQKDPFKNMSLEEIREWEQKQDNSNDIYKIKARVGNLAVSISGGSLTPVGTMMVNSFVHVVKDLYTFADTIPDKTLKIALVERIRSHESMPGSLIAAASAGVKMKRQD